MAADRKGVIVTLGLLAATVLLARQPAPAPAQPMRPIPPVTTSACQNCAFRFRCGGACR